MKVEIDTLKLLRLINTAAAWVPKNAFASRSNIINITYDLEQQGIIKKDDREPGQYFLMGWNKMKLLEVEKKVLRQFGANTFTTELDNNSVWVQRLVKKGLIDRHPGGPFGSRCSYYRTETGMQIWKELDNGNETVRL